LIGILTAKADSWPVSVHSICARPLSNILILLTTCGRAQQGTAGHSRAQQGSGLHKPKQNCAQELPLLLLLLVLPLLLVLLLWSSHMATPTHAQEWHIECSCCWLGAWPR
jgi:hypothetical protein